MPNIKNYTLSGVGPTLQLGKRGGEIGTLDNGNVYIQPATIGNQVVVVNGQLITTGAQIVNRTEVDSSIYHAVGGMYSVKNTDYIIGLTDTTHDLIIQFPKILDSELDMTGITYIIKDETGDITSNAISITIQGYNNSELIDGEEHGTVKLTRNYGTLSVYCNGTSWSAMAG